MIKYILIFLLSFPAMAEVKVQRLSDGYILVFDNNCWGIPQTVDLESFPTKLTPVPEASNNWPAPTGETLTKCTQALQSYTVQPWRTGDTMRNVYDIPQGKVIGKIAVGSKCGEIVAPYQDWAEWGYGKVTVNGLDGVTVCKK